MVLTVERRGHTHSSHKGIGKATNWNNKRPHSAHYAAYDALGHTNIRPSQSLEEQRHKEGLEYKDHHKGTANKHSPIT